MLDDSPDRPSTDDDGRWVLTDLYAGFDDPRRAADQERAHSLAEGFAARYRGRIASLDGPQLVEAFHAFENISRLVHRLMQYCSLRFSADTRDTAARAAVADARRFGSEVTRRLTFFTLELKELDEAHVASLPGAAAVAPFAHYLAYQRVFKPFTLSEEVEQTVSRKDVTGKSSWVQLYDQITSAIEFEVEVEGDVRTYTRGELYPLMESPDRTLRERATQAMVDGFEPHRDTLTFIFNTLFEDHRAEMEARDYPDVLRYTILRDDLTPEIALALIDSVNAARDLMHRYQALRARTLDVDVYGTEDRLVSIFGQEPGVPWDEGKRLVLDAFDAFDGRVGDIARRFFDGQWVDVFPRPGKRTGAFCSPGLPPDHPYVLLNYAGRLDDAFTLAHELGHGMHGVLSGVQSPLNYGVGLPLAETASVFAELLLHKRLMESWKDPARRRQLLDRQVFDAMGTAWRQVAYINWERRAHDRRAQGVASPEDYSAIWQEEMAALYGGAMHLRERDSWGWVTIPHFVFARFYCYSYAFGKLLTLSLYGVWQERGEAFVDQYLDLLSAGGARSPKDLVAAMGLDLADPGFWERGIAVVRGYLDELEG